MILGPDGKITHFRFTHLSSLDSVNKGAYEFLKKQHFKPVVVDGKRVSVCTTDTVLTHFE